MNGLPFDQFPHAAGWRSNRNNLYLCEKEEPSMKKLLTILLSMALVLSLAVPAFAAPAPDAAPVDDTYTVDGEAVPVYQPGDAIPISAILDSLTPEEALGIIGGADGPTAIITSGPIGSIDWEDFANLPDDNLAELLQQQRDENKKALGGVPGQVGVMVNGAYIQFPDAVPEETNGRTMVPVRALVEALGGEVDYQDDVVTFTMDGYAYAFAVGSTTVKVSVTADNDKDTPEPEDIQMDCAPYIKDGRTYVPVRFISEALGYDVGWDAFYETAILLDRDALTSQIDEKFTILNKVQANKSIGMEEGKNYRSDAKGNISLTLFDTLNGSKTYKADLTAKQLFNTDAASADVSLKLSDNAVDDLLEQVIGASTYADDEDVELLRSVLTGLEDMELIMTKEGSVWFRMAALDELAGEDNVWLDADLGADWGELAFTQAGDATIGKVLVRFMPCESVTEWGSVMEMVNLLDSLYGDDQFTTSGGTSTLTIDLDTLMGLYADMGLDESDLEEAKAAFKEYKITMKVDSRGGAAVTCNMETAAQTGVPGMKITMDVTQSGGNVSMTMNYHIANMGEMKVEVTETQRATSDKPLTEPPEGATLVDMDNGAELLVP